MQENTSITIDGALPGATATAEPKTSGIPSIIQSYIDIINKTDLLDNQTEQTLTRAYHDQQCYAARNKLVNANLRLVLGLAKKYSRDEGHYIELIQEGLIGLLKSLDRFDPSLGYRFSTYATWWIKQGILSYLNEAERAVNIPSSVYKNINQKRKYLDQLTQEANREPTDREIAQIMGIPMKKYEKLQKIEYELEQMVSLDASVASGDGVDTTISDMVADPNTRSVEEQVNLNMFKEILNSLLERVLTKKERYILRSRYALNTQEKTYSLNEISQELGLSIERVRQIEKQTVKKLQEYYLSGGIGHMIV